jgi:hypothetical protein
MVTVAVTVTVDHVLSLRQSPALVMLISDYHDVSA